MKLQKLGGYAAIVYVCLSLVGAFIGLRTQRIWNLDDPVSAMAAISSSPAIFYFSYYLGIVNVILSFIVFFAICERLKAKAPVLTLMAVIALLVANVATFFMNVANATAIEYVIPINDVSVYQAFDAFTQSLWVASGHAFAWIGFLIGIAVLKTNAFPKTPAWFFILMGIFWLHLPIPVDFGNLRIIALIPYLALAAGTFWFGIAMLRQREPDLVDN